MGMNWKQRIMIFMIAATLTFAGVATLATNAVVGGVLLIIGLLFHAELLLDAFRGVIGVSEDQPA
jgi:hypothetical protein